MQVRPAALGRIGTVVRFSESSIEAAWLAALLLVPLTFWPLSDSAGNPIRGAVFEVLFVAALVAWLVKVVAGGRLVRPAAAGPLWLRWSKVTTLVVLVHALALGLGTVLSLDSALSWNGNFSEAWGVRHQLELLVFFFLVFGHLRDEGQLGRILGVIILGSLPIALYAILQRFGLDPLPWLGESGAPARNPRMRTMATLGNPTLLGAYLLYPIFVTLGVLANFLTDTPATGRVPFNWRHLGLGLTFLTQVTALVLCASRAPFFALLAGMTVLIAGRLGSWRFRPRARWLAVSGAVILFVTGAGAIFLLRPMPDSGEQSGDLNDTDRRAGALTRLTDLSTNSGSVEVRRRLWTESLELVRERPRVLSANGPDGRARWRPLTGYGPHAADLTLPSRSRPHNRLIEALITTGWPGLFAEAGLHLLVLALAVRWCCGSGRGQWLGSAGFIAATSSAAAGSAVWLGQFELVVAAATVGAILGLLMSMVVLRTARRLEPAKAPWLRLALLAALCAHLVNQSFSDDYLVLRLLFWLALACLLMPLERVDRDPSADSPDSLSSNSESWKSGSPVGDPSKGELFDGAAGACCTIILGLWLLVGFTVPDHGIDTPLDLLLSPPFAAWWLLLGTVFVAVVLSGPLPSGRRRGSLGTLTLAAVTVAVYDIVLARWIEVLRNGLPSDSAERFLMPVFVLSGSMVVMALLSVLLLAFALDPRVPRSAKIGGLRSSARLPPLLGVALGVAVAPVLLAAPYSSFLAHSLAGEAERASRADRGLLAVRLAQEAARYVPHADHLEYLAGRLALDVARTEPESALRASILAQAEGHLTRAVERSPFDSDHVANLGRYRVQRAILVPGREEKMEQLRSGAELYALALRMRPSLPNGWLELAQVQLRLGDEAAARATLERGLTITPDDAELKARLDDLLSRLGG